MVTLAPTVGQKGIIESINLTGVFPVGRLDKDSHGLIILTNDGRITDRLLNPKHTHEKEYVVKVKEKLRGNFKEKAEAGVQIENEKTAPCKVKILGDKKFSIILGEGKKHQIRRMCSALFSEVEDLERVRIMNIELGKLGSNQYRKIEGEELKVFLKGLGL
jgi:23S rRNA pseudouridine2604 synthase